MRLYQFIGGGDDGGPYGLQAIADRRLKISRIEQLNDPFEMLAGTQSDPKTRLASRLFREVIGERFGILCFSRDWHNPVLWSHYADRHRGLCLGFDVRDETAMPVRYVSRRLAADHFMAPETSEAEVRRLTGELACTKFAHWRYEQEVRSWASVDPDGPNLQYSPFTDNMKLVEVIIGFQSAITRPMVGEALGALGDQVKVINTRLAFRTFRVVTQQNRKMWR